MHEEASLFEIYFYLFIFLNRDFLIFFKKTLLIFILEEQDGKKKEKERNIDVREGH